MSRLYAPFVYFGGKRSVIDDVWIRFGSPTQYIEPFCGSAAMLLGAPTPAKLEVVSDGSGFIANFWRAVKYQPDKVAEWADYPISHVDMHARHGWLMKQRAKLTEGLSDPNWPGDAKVAGWWLWGQNIWIAGGWCEWDGKEKVRDPIPTITTSQGIQKIGKILQITTGSGVGGIPQINDTGRGIMGSKKNKEDNLNSKMLTSTGRTAMTWLRDLTDRLDRVRVLHGDWSRCLNHYVGGEDTAVFLDPPYRAYEKVYGSNTSPVANEVEEWAWANQNLKIALCGIKDDYDLPGWEIFNWSRGSATYAGGTKTTDLECIWFSPPCRDRNKAGQEDWIKKWG